MAKQFISTSRSGYFYLLIKIKIKVPHFKIVDLLLFLFLTYTFCTQKLNIIELFGKETLDFHFENTFIY